MYKKFRYSIKRQNARKISLVITIIAIPYAFFIYWLFTISPWLGGPFIALPVMSLIIAPIEINRQIAKSRRYPNKVIKETMSRILMMSKKEIVNKLQTSLSTYYNLPILDVKLTDIDFALDWDFSVSFFHSHNFVSRKDIFQSHQFARINNFSYPIIITNQTYSDDIIELALDLGVSLVDFRGLARLFLDDDDFRETGNKKSIRHIFVTNAVDFKY